MSDYYDGIDREGEMEQRLIDKVYSWWDSLDDEDQHTLILDYYPNTFTEDDNANDFFDDLINDGQRDMAGDLEYEERKLRGGDME